MQVIRCFAACDVGISMSKSNLAYPMLWSHFCLHSPLCELAHLVYID